MERCVVVHRLKIFLDLAVDDDTSDYLSIGDPKIYGLKSSFPAKKECA